MFPYSRLWTAGLFGLVMLFLLSCSGGGNPLAPPSAQSGGEADLGLTQGSGTGDINQAPDDQLMQGQPHEGQSAGLWGIFDIAYDNSSGSFVVMPLRGVQSTFNILTFLQPPNGDPANLGISIIDKTNFLSQGLMTIEITITHPFASPRLVGFDTIGLLIGNGSVPYNEDPGVLFSGSDDLRLLNSDGYTRWMNPVEFTDSGALGYTEGLLGSHGQTWTATVNPYKYFAEGLGSSDDLGTYLDDPAYQALRGAFQPDTSNSRLFEFQFPMSGGSPVPKFQYGIISHFMPAKDQNGDPIPNPTIEDFDPAANAPETIHVIADTTNSTLYHDAVLQTSGGDLIIDLTVYDWQGMDSLGGAGAFAEINSIGLDSPDGLFGASGMKLVAADLTGTEVSSPGSNPTVLNLLITGLTPQHAGTMEILLAIYSEDPSSYDQGFGSAYPQDAHLAGYTRTSVFVSDDGGNVPPVIDEIQGPIEVDCWAGETVYTCIAHDPNPDDEILFSSAVQPMDIMPIFPPPTDDNTITIDWSNESEFPPGLYDVWFQVTDGELTTKDRATVTKIDSGLLIDEITADDDDTYNVLCTNVDAMYTVIAQDCDPQAEIIYRWLRGFGNPPDFPDPEDPGWSNISPDNFIIYDWGYTEIGPWWIIAMCYSDTSKGLSPFYIVERIDTPPTGLNPPEGETEVNCSCTQEEYLLTGGEDCDGGTFERQWTITDSDEQPTAGWVTAMGDSFIVNWSVYPIGTYYAWHRVGSDENFTCADPLEIHRLNTPPDPPNPPEGPGFVDCTFVDALYQAGVVTDCEGDPVTREWALGTEFTPPDTGWVGFTGVTFTIDYSTVPSGEKYLFQRASDDGLIWSYSIPFPVIKFNSPPDKLDPVDGPGFVTCLDIASEYQAGVATDCDFGDVLTRFYNVSPDSLEPSGEWEVFSGTSFTIDWSGYVSGMWYLFQQVSDGELESISISLEVTKGNSPPVVGPPTGPTDVDCTSIDVEYNETEVSDCDPFTTLYKSWYLSLTEDTPTGGTWLPYEGTSFIVDFLYLPSGDLYLFLSAHDGEAETIGDPFHIVRHNTAPEKPQVPDGPTEVNCMDLPVIYEGGAAIDCDPFDPLERYHYLSTDPITPTGGTWIADPGEQLIVDFNGVIAEDTYYLFQKVSDGSLEAISDSLAVVYHNTAPEDPPPPLGATLVSCANDDEEYYGGEKVNDCDTWQTIIRSWVVNDVDWPPATGWTEFSGTTWNIDWSTYDQGIYYMFQRGTDGFEYAYSLSLMVEVGPPTLIQPDTPSGNEDPICDGPTETYDAGEYLASCPSLDIIRDWAYNTVPTPPAGGWELFTGTTFDVDLSELGFGFVYLYQRARLDAQEEISKPLLVNIHPGELGVPPAPIGPATVNCESTAEDYDMGDVSVACPGTPVTRHWQIQTTSGTPLIDWQEFTASPVIINWTVFSPGYNYHLVQKADDGEHVQTSDPLVVTFENDAPEFLGTLTGPTAVTCTDTLAIYDGGEVEDCDHYQTLTREWAWNTIDTYPIDGWTEMYDSSFFIDYSSPDIQPGDIYLFQRVNDGVVEVYDNSLHVVYTNSPPDTPNQIQGDGLITCLNLQQTYDTGDVSDCDGTTLTREWTLTDIDTPPADNWIEFTGNSFDYDWSGANFGEWYLFQRATDGELISYSVSLPVFYKNSNPTIVSFTCDEGAGPFDSDGQTEGLTGIDLFNTLHFTFDVSDCDGEEVDNSWTVTTSTDPLPFGDPAWNGPIAGDSFTADLTAYAPLAPSILYVHLGSSDGTNFTSVVWEGTINMWDLVWLTTYADIGDMWSEHACLTGIGSYTWNYDSGNEYLRLENYGSSSMSAVWSDPIAFPSAPGPDSNAQLLTYMNPATAMGLDNTSFSFLYDSTCAKYPLDVMSGKGCDAELPQLTQLAISETASMWGDSWRVGLLMDGFDGCAPSNYWVDWVGIWIQPN